MASNSLFLAPCFSFSNATSPTCLTLSLDKPILQIQHKNSNQWVAKAYALGCIKYGINFGWYGHLRKEVKENGG